MAKPARETFILFQEHLMQLFGEQFAQKATGTIVNPTAFETAKKQCEKDCVSVRKAGIKMLAQYDYTPEREKFLINQTLMYIKLVLRNPTQSHTTDLLFLQALVNQISETFSYYIMRKHQIPADVQAQTRLRLTVQAEIHAQLFTDNEYIKRLYSQSKSARKKFKETQQCAQAIAAYNVNKETNNAILNAQYASCKARC